MFANYLIEMNFKRQLLVFIFLATFLIGSYTSSYAQTDQGLGNWNTILIKGKISSKFSLFCEGHIRSSNYDLKYDYFEIKAGIGCSVTNNFTVFFGTGFFNTDEPGSLFQTPALQKEFRTWLELNLKQVFNRFNFEHRARVEQRLLGDNYKNRLKYRLGLLLPVNKAEIVQGSIYLAVNDELFIPQYGPRVVEKNRFYLGAGYKISPNTALQIGGVGDTDYNLHGQTVKNYLQIMVIYDFANLHKKHV
jgi:hypothetical protein